MEVTAGGIELTELGPINVILGKNGCGKSRLLKAIEGQVRSAKNGRVVYISPERGGLLTYEPNIEQNITNNENWLNETRRQNQAGNFRQQSAVLFRRLEILTLREIEAEHVKPGYVPRNFNGTLDQINTLLDRVRIERSTTQAFQIFDRSTNNPVGANEISSGESELISLGIEFLAFVREAAKDKDNFLLVDEPDVHLHPDLQDRLARFISKVLMGHRVTLILATHSTALLAGLADQGQARVAFMKRGDNSLRFRLVSDVDRDILPVFGAHPLSNVFNQSPILLVEGEDDERVWQQAVRSSAGKIRVYPCQTDSIDNLSDYEDAVSSIIGAVYDDAVGYSLRDRDEAPEEINDKPFVKRMRLACRAAENLMLSNEALARAGVDWATFIARATDWVARNNQHPYFAVMQEFADGGFDRRSFDLKNIRNICIGLVSNKPWEVLVGQTIAEIAGTVGPTDDGTLRAFLGVRACELLLKIPAVEVRPTN